MKKILLFSMGLASAVLLLVASADAFTVSGRSITRESADGRSRVTSVCERVTGRLNVSFICTGESDSGSDFPSFGFCGNETIDLGEDCDGSAPQGYLCTSQCELVEDTNQSGNNPQCGNDIVEDGEQCDGSAPEGYVCTSSCALHDVSVVGDGIVINEVYADPDSRHGVKPNNEWIELYNAGDQTVNLKDWSLVDNGSIWTRIKQSVELAPHEFAVVVSSASTYNYYWSIPEDAHIIILGGIIGDGLQDTGDVLYLYNAENVLVDSMSYGFDNSVFSLGKASKGDSLSRIAPGVDSDLAEDWVRLDQPTPGF